MATANNLGTAYIRIAPQMQGIQATISSALNQAGSSGGDAFNKGFSAKAGAIAGVISSVTTKAINAISNQFDNAITRVDTLNVFPKIMKNLGYETDESTRSIERLTQRIEGLPTTLDEIVTWTQRLASSLDSLADGEMNATDLAIAFNDAALSGGKGQAEANRAFEQYVQIIGRGRPMMQDWKIMLEVMPGQLKQMAKYLGQNSASLQEYAANAKKTVDQLDGMDLYEWISESKNAYARERLAEFNEALVKLDNEGGAGITSFKEQVGDATQTISTAMRLIGVRISKALATVIKAFGSKDIYDVVDKFTKSFAKVGEWVANYVVPPLRDDILPALKVVFSAIKNITKAILGNETARRFLAIMLETFVAFKIVAPIFATLTAAMATFGTAMTAAQATSLGLVGGIAAIITVANILAESIKAINLAQQRNADLHRYSQQQIVNEENALRNLNQARALEQQILDDIEVAKRLQNDAEYQELQAKQRLTEAQSAYDKALKDSNATSDEKRMKALELKAAEDAYTDAVKKHASAVGELDKLEKQKLDNTLTTVHRNNQLINTQILEAQNYGTLAKRLDELKNQTIEYQDAKGNVMKLTKEEMANVSDWYAEELGRQDSTWRTIIENARKNGQSYVEAAEEYGKLAGIGTTKYFKAGVDEYKPYVTQATDDLIKEISNTITAAGNRHSKGIIGEAEAWGAKIMIGLNEGLKGKVTLLDTTLGNIFGVRMPQKVRDLLGIHSPSRVFATIGEQIDQGLIGGLNSYSDDIERKAEEIANSVVDPFDKQAELGLGANNYSSYSGNMAALAAPQQNQVVQNNTFNQVADDLDVEQASKLLGWQVATAL